MKKLKLNKETVAILENGDQKSILGGNVVNTEPFCNGDVVSRQGGCANFTISCGLSCTDRAGWCNGQMIPG